ncbi:hypothetical protein FACS1894160_0180 [Bacteroidia bacterium]|nr:hypothetical protein FACS1894123_03540 [Bacteroidia bacterium]GHV07499.1 hypothetical protein FACS1894160_0180 [Bacteroidia bacterium]
MRLIFALVIVSLFSISCNSQFEVKDKDIIVKAGNKILYRYDVEEHIPTGISSADSLITAEHYVRTWVNDVLLYDIALKNTNNMDEINRLVEDYKKSLLIYQYQEQLINERLTKEIDSQTMLDYYNTNKDIYKLDKIIIKGIFLKVPSDAPQIDDIRKWYKTINPVSIENIEKSSVHNAKIYDNFLDKWVDFNDLSDNWPRNFRDEIATVNQKKQIEEQDSTYHYFLNITDYLLPGDNAPFEYVSQIIKEQIINQQRIEFLKKTEQDIYLRAVKSGQVKFYNE